VAVLAVLVGRKLGLERREICDLAVSAALHDAGKVRVPAALIAKPGELSPEERAAIARHPVEGVKASLGAARVLDRTTMARIVTTFEHNAASNGYPERRPNQALHLFSRVVAVVDAYDALTTARPYRRAYLPDEALGEVRRGSGTRFAAHVVRAFTSLLGIYPHGTLVVLETGERAIVLHNDLSDVANPRPIVRVVIEADGLRTDRILDLGTKGEDGDYLTSIVGTDDPARYSIAVAAHAAR
jgi:HD-GYP domain-containing protein (c-di-GMP phosphodiesterase class II)